MITILPARFGDHCVKKWGLSSTEIEDRWQSALRDSNVPKGIDDEGWQTVAKYTDSSLTSARKLSHERTCAKTDSIEANEQQLKSVMSSYLVVILNFVSVCS